MPPEAVDGLMLNIAALEAADDLRFAMVLGAMFGGKDGREYIEHLQETAWAAEPERVETGRRMVEAAHAAADRK